MNIEDVCAELLAQPADRLAAAWDALPVEACQELWPGMHRRLGPAAHRLFIRDPARWIEVVLGESIWTIQREIAAAISRPNASVAIPACHSPGKTHNAARLCAWWGSIWPTDLARCVTTATNWTQVEKLLWQNIASVHRKHSLPGEVLNHEWKIGNTKVMWGFSVANTDDTGGQGVHAPYMLIVVDEAGGIPQAVGDSLVGLQSSGDVRLLVQGNPSTDRQGTWFEQFCGRSDVALIRIPASATPNFTGEETGLCHSCTDPREHRIAVHLVQKPWAERLAEDYGPDSPIVRAKVLALFPTGSRMAVITPESWDLRVGVSAPFDPPRDFISMGLDVAAGGGDEMVLTSWRPDGRLTVDLTEAGEVLKAPEQAGEIVVSAIERVQGEEIMKVIAAAQQRGELLTPDDVHLPVVLKWDADGVGFGMEIPLRQAINAGRFVGSIHPIRSGSRASDRTKFGNKRSEMWWQARGIIRDGLVSLPVDERLRLQATRLEYKVDRSRIWVERKDDMRKRLKGHAASPDRADSLCMTLDMTEVGVIEADDGFDPGRPLF